MNLLTENRSLLLAFKLTLSKFCVLKGSNGWCVIDPKGVSGETAFEVTVYVRNPLLAILKVTHLQELIVNCLHLLAHLLSLEFNRLARWSFVQSVLA